jgi:hypothetical protein
MFLIKTDLICLETDAAGADNITVIPIVVIFPWKLPGVAEVDGTTSTKFTWKSISAIDVVLISKDSFVVFKKIIIYMFNVVIVYN